MLFIHTMNLSGALDSIDSPQNEPNFSLDSDVNQTSHTVKSLRVIAYRRPPKNTDFEPFRRGISY